MNKPSVFSFSDDLRDKVEEALISRMVDAGSNDSDVIDGFVRYGLKGVEDMSSIELMDEYMNWHGTYSLDENPNDDLLRRMMEEVDSYEFEKEVLIGKEEIQFQENCTNPISKEEVG